MAEITLKAKVRVVELGEDGSGKPAITLGFDDGEVLFRATIQQCRAAAPALCREVEATVLVTIPEAPRG